jgi:FMN phosphatase YigB (HAD superfamily)
MDIKAVLIDVGGPILDEDHEYAAWDSFLVGLLTEEGVEVEEERLAQLIGLALQRCLPNPRVAALWELVRPNVEKFRRLKEALRAYQRRHLAEEYEPRLRPGVREALEELAGKYALALAGNQPAWIKEFLAEAGVLKFFRWQLVSEEMGVRKPDPLFFNMILAGVGARPGEAAMVGDRLDHDVLPARLLGLYTVRILVGPYREQLPISPLHCPHRTLPSLAELPAALATGR